MATVGSLSAISHSPLIVRHRFTVEQYHEMIARGIFGEDEPIEFIRGEVVQKMPIVNSHAAAVKRLNRLLSKQIPANLLISIQDPILIDNSEPEPDVAILNFRDDLYASSRPVGTDVRLIVEIADSSLEYDRNVKGPIYAEAGIRDFWILNRTNNTVEVYRDPQPDGRFATATTHKRGETLTPIALNELAVPVDELLGSI